MPGIRAFEAGPLVCEDSFEKAVVSRVGGLTMMGGFIVPCSIGVTGGAGDTSRDVAVVLPGVKPLLDERRCSSSSSVGDVLGECDNDWMARRVSAVCSANVSLSCLPSVSKNTLCCSTSVFVR